MPQAESKTSNSSAAAATSFEPYCRLLRSLLPSLRGAAIHDGFANRVWASDDWSVADEDRNVRDCIANALADSGELPAVMRTQGDDSAVYSFALRGAHADLLGVVSLTTALSASMPSPRSVQYVRQLAQPALECLRRELTLLSALGSRDRALSVREQDLEVMLRISSPGAATSTDADEFALILRTGIERLDGVLAALWVPDKNIALSQAAAGTPSPTGFLHKSRQHLMAWMQLQQRTIVINRVAPAPAAAGAAAPYKILACPVRNASDRVIGVLALFKRPEAEDFDLHQTRIAEMLAKRATNVIQAQYDAGTGLLTRAAFEDQANALLAAAAPRHAHNILYLDIDRLHVINETFGMHVGDRVINAVADCLVRASPAGALTARISGDRLAALVPNMPLREATAVAEEIRRAAAASAPRVGQGSLDVTVSIGIAPVSSSENQLAHAIATAEVACKAAKDRGRNRIEVFQDSDQSIIRRHTDILVIGKVHDALERDGFRLHAQPIMPLRARGGPPRFELLLRMLGDRNEIIPPAKFLSAAERYQLMPTIDRWVVGRACELLGAHCAAVGSQSGRFAINLSGQSLQDESFLDFVVDRIAAHRVAPGMLCFELTETATVGNLRSAQAFMQRLQDLGCQFALDDFGTGVSSLSYLKDLSVNYVKIDGSFIRDITESPRSESMVKAIAQLAAVMGMETIAEYVETDALRVRVAGLGVDYGQGFAVGMTRPLEELLEELAGFEVSVNAPLPAEPRAVRAAG